MKMQPVSPDLQPRVVQALQSLALFKGLDAATLAWFASQGALCAYSQDEAIGQQGEPAESCHVILRGMVSLRMVPLGMSEAFEIDRPKPVEMMGEVETLLGQPRRMTAIAIEAQVLLFQIPGALLASLCESAPAFGVTLAKHCAAMFLHAERKVPLPYYDLDANPPPAEVATMLPPQFIHRQRVLPLGVHGQQLVLGFVDDLTSLALHASRSFLPGLDLLPMRIDASAFNHMLQTMPQLTEAPPPPVETARHDSGPQAQTPAANQNALPKANLRTPGGKLSAPKLDPLLRRMVAEGASDLHLSAEHKPRWRLDGEMRELSDAPTLTETAVWDLLAPAMLERNQTQFISDNDTDFAYALPDVARFRVNVFRDHRGIGAVLRQIPQKILTLEQLGLPMSIQKMCDHPKGLVLVTGPTGSGKSTTLAAMIDYINRNRRTHIITLEDPIEFVHNSQKALVNQREVGPHTTSFARALRAALREDPDIVLVGELRDQETIALALETANTGHLVFGTLHTSTAISTVDRIVDVFPPEQQSQIRAVTAEVLKGVVAQTLCRKKGGGRIAALEVLVGSHAVSNLVREGKNHQISNIMMTAKSQGNMMLNEQLEKLVNDNKIEYDEAIMKAIDKTEFAKRFGKDYHEK
jgi:twitching motility protein PilT